MISDTCVLKRCTSIPCLSVLRLSLQNEDTLVEDTHGLITDFPAYHSFEMGQQPAIPTAVSPSDIVAVLWPLASASSPRPYVGSCLSPNGWRQFVFSVKSVLYPFCPVFPFFGLQMQTKQSHTQSVRVTFLILTKGGKYCLVPA